METVINCKNLYAAYNNSYVLNDISFSVKHGDFISIVGRNGSGKTTLLKLVLGFLKPESGSIEITGSNRKFIGYMPQHNQELKNVPSSVMEVVMSGCINQMNFKPFYTSKEKNIALKNIRRLQIGSLLKSPFQELSGGQQQKVLLARALCATRETLLLDEPTAGLDPSSTSELYSLLHSLNTQDKLTVVMVTHDINAAVTYSNRILHLQNSVVFSGDASIYKHSEHYKILEGDKHD